MEAWKPRGEDIPGRTDFSAVLCFSPCTGPLSQDLLALLLLLNYVTEGSYKAGTESHRGSAVVWWCKCFEVLATYVLPKTQDAWTKKKRVEMTEANQTVSYIMFIYLFIKECL